MSEPLDCPECGLPIDPEIIEQLGGVCAYCGTEFTVSVNGYSRDEEDS
jgi:hypothetical protein